MDSKPDKAGDTKEDIANAPTVQPITKDDVREDDHTMHGEPHEPARTASGDLAKEGVKAHPMPGGGMEHGGTQGHQS